jgi:hypothetical protein
MAYISYKYNSRHLGMGHAPKVFILKEPELESMSGGEGPHQTSKGLLLSLQKILWSMTVDFLHGSSKFRHKAASMTKFQIVMY